MYTPCGRLLQQEPGRGHVLLRLLVLDELPEQGRRQQLQFQLPSLHHALSGDPNWPKNRLDSFFHAIKPMAGFR